MSEGFDVVLNEENSPGPTDSPVDPTKEPPTGGSSVLWYADQLNLVRSRTPRYFTQTLGIDKSTSKVTYDYSYIPFLQALSQCNHEQNEISKGYSLLEEYLQAILTLTVSLERELISEDNTRILQEFFSYYAEDDQFSLSMKLDLLNMSLTKEQLTLYFYVLSEYKDRLSSDPKQILSKVPGFVGYPNEYGKMMPMTDTALVSHHFFSSFFRGQQFQKRKGNNKKVLSVGVTQGLFRKTRDSDNRSYLEKSNLRDDVVRIKVYRLNRLTPEVVFKPISYLFEMNRFPTRTIGNWDPAVLFGQTQFDPLLAPTKLVQSNGSVDLHASFEDAMSKHLVPGTFPAEDFKSLYANHVFSFVLEEYLRWFTDTSFDESRYYNYAELKGVGSIIESQLSSLYDAIKDKPNVEGAVGYATFDTPDGTKVDKTVISSKSDKGAVIDMTQTLKTYLTNETLLLSPVEYKRRATYPKKFDRVFCLAVDPDDFEIDVENSTPAALDTLKKKGIIVGDDGEYVWRDSTQDDAAFDDFFVTLEPYDYVQPMSAK